MSRNHRLSGVETDPETGCPVPRRHGNLLLQFAVIGSGRVPNTDQSMQLTAAGIVEEVLAAASMNGHSMICFPDGALPAPSVLSTFFDWLDAACTAAGPEVVEEIFHRPKQRQLQ